MILFTLRDYIQSHPKCSLNELSKAFALSEDGVEAMLGEWIKRGKLKVTVSERTSGEVRQYIWLDDSELGVTVYQ
ncbi:FeoC-like transcriptional regulator [Grimontia sp. NTOU-MAR1]|uniref:FeoC-like transcriptional regulator n=1 Tax=Grimontia sp. NTOU-MAR1 TaxID=3111011 RepID=UPI002DBB5BCD|nr:FeoC-like transcriptional regulator [Grimontia sp. NTOU-MAR1]WRV97637.1 FeoC-like transcriptional regulator [Grimontia sp. NTOU-MAR1]